jgi:hypothetical protein
MFSRRETARIPVGTLRIEAYRAGMDEQPDTWTMETVTAGLARFYHEIAGVGLTPPSTPSDPPSLVASKAYLRFAVVSRNSW